ncbi:MAG: DUF5765 domain-containing protein, partial [Gammaproteobacteria bacterium]
MHIAFQPFFINMLAMYFIPEEVKHKIARYVYGACWIGVGFLSNPLILGHAKNQSKTLV